MMFNRKEYEVTVTPEGKWQVTIIEHDRAVQGQSGHVFCMCGSHENVKCDHTCNLIGRADEAARAWVKKEESRRYFQRQKEEGNRVFTLPRK